MYYTTEADLETFEKLSSHIGILYKLILEPVKSLNRILWVTEYLYKAKKYQIWSTTAKTIFVKNETNLETFQKRFPYTRVSYKSVLKSVKSLNRFFWAMEFWLKA